MLVTNVKLHFNFYMNNHKKNQIRSITHILSPRNRDFYVYIGAISVVIYSCKDLHAKSMGYLLVLEFQLESDRADRCVLCKLLFLPTQFLCTHSSVDSHPQSQNSSSCFSHLRLISSLMECMPVHQIKFSFWFLFGCDLHS